MKMKALLNSVKSVVITALALGLVSSAYGEGTVSWSVTPAGDLPGDASQVVNGSYSGMSGGGPLSIGQAVSAGSSVSMNATSPLNGFKGTYIFKDWTITGAADPSSTANPYQFTMPALSVTLVANYVKYEPIPSQPIEVANATYKVLTNDVPSADGMVWPKGDAKVVYTANDGWFFAGGVTVSNCVLDTSVNPAVNKDGVAPIAYSWERKVVNSDNSPYVLTEGKTYTAAATDKSGGAFYVAADGTLVGTNVTFASNESMGSDGEGGAVYNIGKTTFNGECGFFDNISSGDGGAISTGSGGEMTFTGAVTFERNCGRYGGAVSCGYILTFSSNATFTDNTAVGANNVGGAIENFGGAITLADVVFSGNSANNGGAVNNENNDDGKIGVITFTKSAIFSGNTANTGNGGAIYNASGCMVNFEGPVALETASDTIFNDGVMKWNLTGGKHGLLNGFQRVSNDVNTGKLWLMVDDYQLPTNILIATGNFENIAGNNTDTFVITNLTSGGAAVSAKIDGAAFVNIGTQGYKLVTEEDLGNATTNLMLQVFEVWTRTKVDSNNSPYPLEEGKTYTAVPTTMSGGAFNMSGGTLVGTNVTFRNNELTSHASGGAIGGTANTVNNIYLDGATFRGNKAQDGGAMSLMGGIATIVHGYFQENTAKSGGGAISVFSGATLALDDVTFTGNTAQKSNSGAINVFNESRVNLDGPVTLATASDTIYNAGVMNWNLTGGKNGLLNGFQNVSNYVNSGKLQLTVKNYGERVEFKIATGNFENVKGNNTDTFVITNAAGGAAVSAKIGGATAANGYVYQLALDEDLSVPTTNLILVAFKPDMQRVKVGSYFEGKYQLGDVVPGDGDVFGRTGYYYGVNVFSDMPPAAVLARTPTLGIYGSVAVSEKIQLPKPNPVLFFGDGAVLSVMGGADAALVAARVTCLRGDYHATIFLDKEPARGLYEYYQQMIQMSRSNIKLIRASIDDAAVKDTLEDGFYNVNTDASPASAEDDKMVVTSSIVMGDDNVNGIVFKVNDGKSLEVAGPVAVETATPQTLKLVKETSGDLNVSGKMSGFDTVMVNNKNSEGKLTTARTIAAAKEIIVRNEGHLDAKLLAGKTIFILNTTPDTLIGEYSGEYVYVTNTANGVAQDVVLQAYGESAMKRATVFLTGEDGSIYYNATLVSGYNATPGDIAANDGSGRVICKGTNTFSGSLKVKSGSIENENNKDIVRFDGANVVSSGAIINPVEISGECNISSNELGTMIMSGAITLKDGAVLGGDTRIKSTCANDKFAIEGTVTLKDGAEISRGGKISTVEGGNTLVLKGATIKGSVIVIKGSIQIESGENKFEGAVTAYDTSTLTIKSGSSLASGIMNYGIINLEGGDFIGSLMMMGGCVNWNLTEGTTILNWAKVNQMDGAFQATVGEVTSGTYYTLATNVTDAITDTFTITNSVLGGAAGTIQVGGITQVAGQFWTLSVTEGNLVLAAYDAAKLTNVALTKPGSGVTNATAVIKASGMTIVPAADGSYNVPKGVPLNIVYLATDGYMFKPGWKKCELALDALSGDYAMTRADKKSVIDRIDVAWADERDVTVDTRDQIVVTNIYDILPIAYSTNNWGDRPNGYAVSVDVDLFGSANPTTIVQVATENSYAEWFPMLGALGKYNLQMYVAPEPNSVARDQEAFIYYTAPFTVRWSIQDWCGAIEAVKTNINHATTKPISSGDTLLGLVDTAKLTATPVYNGTNRYAFVNWTACTDDMGAELHPEWLTDANKRTAYLTMPLTNVFVTANIICSNDYETITVNPGEDWFVYADNKYNQIVNNGKVVFDYIPRPEGREHAPGLADFQWLSSSSSGSYEILIDSTATTNGIYVVSTNVDDIIEFTVNVNGQEAEDKLTYTLDGEDGDYVYFNGRGFVIRVIDGVMYLQMIDEIMVLLDVSEVPVVTNATWTYYSKGRQIKANSRGEYWAVSNASVTAMLDAKPGMSIRFEGDNAGLFSRMFYCGNATSNPYPVVIGEELPAEAKPWFENVAYDGNTRLDTRSEIWVTNVCEILPIWQAKGATITVTNLEQQLAAVKLIKSAPATNVFAWVPSVGGDYEFRTVSSRTNLTGNIYYYQPVEVANTNGVANTTWDVDTLNTPRAGVITNSEGKVLVQINSWLNANYYATKDGEKQRYFANGDQKWTAPMPFLASDYINYLPSDPSMVPDTPDVPHIMIGVTAQRYPWNGLVDINYRACNVPANEVEPLAGIFTATIQSTGEVVTNSFDALPKGTHELRHVWEAPKDYPERQVNDLDIKAEVITEEVEP